MKKILMFVILGVFLISFTSALNCWTEEKQNNDILLLQKCPTCSYVNITFINYPNGTVLMNNEMTQNGTNFYFDLPDSSQLGKVSYGTIGDKNGASPPEEETICILITPTGRTIDNSEAIIYLILAFGVLLLFSISAYFTIVTPYSNKLDENGAVIQVSKLKYVKLGLILLSWVLLTWFLNILIGLADNFVSLTMYYGFFGFVFDIMNRLAYPVGIFILILSFFEIIKDANIQEAISKFGSSKGNV